MSGNDLEDMSYNRLGYFDQGRYSDELVASFTTILPGDGVLPHRWVYTTPEEFVATFGVLGVVVWAKARSSHLLLIGGQKILRIWTDMSNACYVDLRDNLVGCFGMEHTEAIPAGNLRKCKPFTRRKKIYTVEDMERLARCTKRIHGV